MSTPLAPPVSLRKRVESLLYRREQERSRNYAVRDDPTVCRILRAAAARAAEELTWRMVELESLPD